MPLQPIYQTLLSNKTYGKRSFAVLIDPDKAGLDQLPHLTDLAVGAGVDFFFVGGSLLMHDKLEYCLDFLKRNSPIPTVIFPGSPLQISKNADALLLLSLISGRNPELLIGQHVIAAPYLKAAGIEVISTGYILVESGKATTVSYMSNSMPVPADKPDIAACTAMAGEMLGLKLIYLDAGSGAQRSIPAEMIRQVRLSIEVPLIVGGGLRTPEDVLEKYRAGADVIVVGNALEKDPGLLREMAQCAG